MSYKQGKIKVPRFNEESGFYTTKARSRQMSKIRSKETKPEIKFRKALWHLGYRYRKNTKTLIGKPDIVFNKYKTVIFIDGEFWHGYQWEEKKQKIKSNRGFWIPKIERNMQRDEEVNNELKEQGYKVFRFWSNEIKNHLNSCLAEVIKHLENIEDEPNFQTP
jgi:DNA mismatch endonuclease (patch repair protein)